MLVASVLLAIGLAFTPVPVLTVVPITVFIVVLCSLVIVQPGQTRVIQFFGRYVGTVRRTGLAGCCR